MSQNSRDQFNQLKKLSDEMAYMLALFELQGSDKTSALNDYLNFCGGLGVMPVLPQQEKTE